MSEEKQTTEKQPSAKRKSKKLAIAGIVVVALVAVGVGMMVWHEQPSFCSTMCHIEGTYVDNYMQEQNAKGVDKYGHEVSNTNAMMAVLHRSTKATAKPEIVCVDCHVPNMVELAHDGMNFVSGNYPLPRDERNLSGLMSWDGKPGESFCANENCHVYLLGSDGELDYDKLEASTKTRAFNPHEQHHENLTLDCSSCHKGHRASVLVCTGCHEHENVALPDGWLTYDESQELMKETFPGAQAA
jgi:hypothetical protein